MCAARLPAPRAARRAWRRRRMVRWLGVSQLPRSLHRRELQQMVGAGHRALRGRRGSRHSKVLIFFSAHDSPRSLCTTRLRAGSGKWGGRRSRALQVRRGKRLGTAGWAALEVPHRAGRRHVPVYTTTSRRQRSAGSTPGGRPGQPLLRDEWALRADSFTRDAHPCVLGSAGDGAASCIVVTVRRRRHHSHFRARHTIAVQLARAAKLSSQTSGRRNRIGTELGAVRSAHCRPSPPRRAGNRVRRRAAATSGSASSSSPNSASKQCQKASSGPRAYSRQKSSSGSVRCRWSARATRTSHTSRE